MSLRTPWDRSAVTFIAALNIPRLEQQVFERKPSFFKGCTTVWPEQLIEDRYIGFWFLAFWYDLLSVTSPHTQQSLHCFTLFLEVCSCNFGASFSNAT